MTSDPTNPPPDSPQIPPSATNAGSPSDSPSAINGEAQVIIARPGQYYRNTRYIMAALTVVMGFWFGYDGFVRWPAENAKLVAIDQEMQFAKSQGDAVTVGQKATEKKRHSYHNATDIRLQKILAFGLPPLGIALLIWALYNSRGEYRLADNTLHVPGCPPVPLSAIRELDEQAWDRKGIAVIQYELATGQTGVVKLDDFVYDRPPTDDIYERIKAYLHPASGDIATPSEVPTT